jgi:Tfp pilus assembly protein PilV
MVTGKRDAEELLLIEEADAWFEYLEATRSQSAARYRELEPWAWARLMQRMRAIKTRRAKLRPAAAA